MKKFLASLLNTPMLVERAWLEATMSLMNLDGMDALETGRSFPIEGTFRAKQRDNVAIIPVTGPIFPRPNMYTRWFGIGTTTEELAKDILAVKANPEITDTIMVYDTPGGSVTAVNETAKLLYSFRDAMNISAYVAGTAASAGYWFASTAGEIVVDETSRLGSIGVVATLENPKNKEDSWTIEMVNTASPNKRPDLSTDEGRKEIMQQLDALAGVFIQSVADYRGVSVSAVENDFGKGGILVGQRAIDVGMADRLGSLESLIEEKLDSSAHTGFSALDTNTQESEEEDQDMKLTKKELKAKFPDIYKAVYDEGVAAAGADAKAVYDEGVAAAEADAKTKLDAKDAEIKGLKKDLSEEVDANEKREERIRSLEKAEAKRSEKDMAAVADTILDAKLGASGLNPRIQGKVRKFLDYNAHVKDGVLDVDGFKSAIDAEIKDWEGIGANTADPLQGPSTEAANYPSGENEAEDKASTDIADRMASRLGLE